MPDVDFTCKVASIWDSCVQRSAHQIQRLILHSAADGIMQIAKIQSVLRTAKIIADNDLF